MSWFACTLGDTRSKTTKYLGTNRTIDLKNIRYKRL